MAQLRVVPFKTRLRVPVGDVIEREGILIEGPAGWGECSPLPSWSDDEREAAKHISRLEHCMPHMILQEFARVVRFGSAPLAISFR